MILYILIIAVMIVLSMIMLKREGFEEKEPEIPLNIFQTWHTKSLPMHMQKNMDNLRKQNPEFKYHLYDDDDCRDFIEKHFESDVLDAYDRLVPGAYKADLWRYCVLYIHGGVYLDMKMRCVGDFRLIEVIDNEHYVKDLAHDESNIYIYNAVLIQKKKNPLMMKCIKQVVKNVNMNYYGNNTLYPTGPAMLGLLYREYKYNYNLPEIDMFHVLEGEKIVYDGRTILEHYPEYRREQVNNQKVSHYSELWEEHSIYIL